MDGFCDVAKRCREKLAHYVMNGCLEEGMDKLADLRCFAQDEPRIVVESEDQPERMLLETKISKDDGYQKQQGQTLQFTEIAIVRSLLDR